jgi:crotonobetainyl-CoA:carnitine CoA-transferase CaiB-like acyl-CoA transferase
MPPEAVEEILQKAGVGAGTVSDARDIDEDPQMNYYNFYRELDHPYMGRCGITNPASEAVRRRTQIKLPSSSASIRTISAVKS